MDLGQENHSIAGTCKKNSQVIWPQLAFYRLNLLVRETAEAGSEDHSIENVVPFTSWILFYRAPSADRGCAYHFSSMKW